MDLESGKGLTNFLDHKVRFALAKRIFGVPMIATRLDSYPHEERWQSVGKPSADIHVSAASITKTSRTLPDAAHFASSA